MVRSNKATFRCDRIPLLAVMLALTLILPAVALAQTPDVPVHDTLLKLPRDLSPWGMFMAADIVVKAVMVGLVFASVLTWTIWFAKAIELLLARRRMATAIGALNTASSWAEVSLGLKKQRNSAAPLISAADIELKMSAGAISPDGLKERIASRLERVEAAAAADRPRHRDPGHHRRDRALRRAVRHRLGHHEQLHRHLEGAHHQSRGGGARHRRSAAGDRARPGRRDPGGGDLQHVLALDRRLSRAARRRLGAGDAARQPRSRSSAWSVVRRRTRAAE